MATLVNSFSIDGIEGYLVECETDTMFGEQRISIIGLGDQAIKEAGERIQSTVINKEYDFPKMKIVINLAPSHMKKRGSHFDLAMAIGLLVQTSQITVTDLEDYGFIGELSLNGKIRACNGVLPMVIAAKKANIKSIIVSNDNIEEARLVKNIDVYGFSDIQDVIDFLEGRNEASPSTVDNLLDEHQDYQVDFSEVKGQDILIDYIVVAAAGGHNMVMIGEPGCGKSMIASRIPTILPKMSEEESLEVTKIYSVSGLLRSNSDLITTRPFRTPHHSASLNSLIGGGNFAMPGEVSLAHNGVLFLDELAEFSKKTLDSLRQPMEDKKVTIARVNATHVYPANFMFVAAMNPCPCGYYGTKKCRCTDYEVQKYRGRISGPILDRIDIQKYVKPVDFFELTNHKNGRTSKELRERVENARAIQRERYKDIEGINSNAQMSSALIKKHCGIDEESRNVLRQASENFGYSARTINKLLRLARTLADLDGAKDIRKQDIINVLLARDLDKDTSKMLTV